MEREKTNDVECHKKQYSVAWHGVIMCVIELENNIYNLMFISLYKHTSVRTAEGEYAILRYLMEHCIWLSPFAG